GAFCGACLGVPLLTLGVALADPVHAVDEILIHVAIFAGVPATVTAGGVARLAADRLADSAAPRWRAALKTTLPALGVAGARLGVLIGVPLRTPSLARAVVAAAAAGIVLGAAEAWLV